MPVQHARGGQASCLARCARRTGSVYDRHAARAEALQLLHRLARNAHDCEVVTDVVEVPEPLPDRAVSSLLVLAPELDSELAELDSELPPELDTTPVAVPVPDPEPELDAFDELEAPASEAEPLSPPALREEEPVEASRPEEAVVEVLDCFAAETVPELWSSEAPVEPVEPLEAAVALECVEPAETPAAPVRRTAAAVSAGSLPDTSWM